jgi:hypothetical protein
MLISFAAKSETHPCDTIPADLRVSLITCYPGPEVYQLCGHAALRVQTQDKDIAFNYGVFDFRQPHFIYRFVSGETDYYLLGYPFSDFLEDYRRRGSKVVEQELNLTPAEAARLTEIVYTESLPGNNQYRYNYVKDNCATRILMRLDEAVDQRIVYPDSLTYGTFRREMRAFHKNYPWYQFGIDLALGSGIDYKLTGREETFAPVEMERKVANAHFADGRPLVKSETVIYEGQDDATLPPTPWWLTPIFCSCIMLVIAVVAAIAGYKVRLTVTSLYFFIVGLGGCLVSFLVFISEHEATSPNVLIWWLNPIPLFAAVMMWFGNLRPAVRAIMYVLAVMTGILLIVLPFQHQSINIAVYPLMLSSLILTVAYISKYASMPAITKKVMAKGVKYNNKRRRK